MDALPTECAARAARALKLLQEMDLAADRYPVELLASVRRATDALARLGEAFAAYDRAAGRDGARWAGFGARKRKSES